MSDLERLIEFYGSQEELAKQWGISPSAVSQWVSAGQLPFRRMLSVYELTGGEFTPVLSMDGTLGIDRVGAKNGKN